ncbi:MAG: hypothetical protein HKN42_13150 [Granulosicoccus sp.]|nr:hypothetical protein [Granulosicoccus sp.]
MAGEQVPEQHDQARRLAMLVMLLLALHVLFGITGIMGVLIAHTSMDRTAGTPYQSQLRWLIITFWTAFTGYAVALGLWFRTDSFWPVLIVMAYVAYRLARCLQYWLHGRPIPGRY